MTPQQAYEKRYAHIDGGQHTWDAAPPHVKEMWLAAWTIAWAMGEEAEREAWAEICDGLARRYGDGPELEHFQQGFGDGAWVSAAKIRARGQG